MKQKLFFSIAILVIMLVSVYNGVGATFDMPKNIIIMISDGMGYYHVDATNAYRYGALGQAVYERFPVRLAMSTYMIDGEYDPQKVWESFEYVHHHATDSAAAATAISTGQKTKSGKVGVDADDQPLRHLAQAAMDLNKSAGVITNVPWTHATPACFIAHNRSRGNTREIGHQMVYDSSLTVIMGAGHPWFDNDGNPVDEAIGFGFVGGESTWNDLVAGTAGNDMTGDGQPDPWHLVQTRDEFLALADGPTPARVLGTAQVFDTIQKNRTGESRQPFDVQWLTTVPTLAEMTRGALNVLDNNPIGLFLMVEGGAVDWAGHANDSVRMVEEMIDFENAVQAVVDWVESKSSWQETLLIVTGDHETGYLTGIGSDPEWQPIEPKTLGVLPEMEWHSGGHTNSLIPLFAKGVGSEMFVERATKIDPVRGPYLDLTEIGLVGFHFWDQPSADIEVDTDADANVSERAHW